MPMLPTTSSGQGSAEMFSEKLAAIGGAAVTLEGDEAIRDFIQKKFPDAKRIVSFYDGLPGFARDAHKPHEFQDCDLAIVRAEFGIAENGAVWITNASLDYPVLPFISQHLIAVIHHDEIVNDMHEAYTRIGTRDYAFASFLAGPSKTADIEQSLVLGAHGPKSMTVIILKPGT